MADPYASALGLKAPGGVPSAILSPQEQASSDAMERGPTGKDGFDLAYINATPAQRVDMERSLRLAAAKPAQAPQAANDPYASALGIGGPAPTPVAAPAKAGNSWAEALPEEGTPEQQARHANNNALGGAVVQGVTGLGANIIGGWRGISSLISSLASGDDLNKSLMDAADATEHEVASRTIAVRPGSDADVVGRSSLNPGTWPGAVGGAAGNKVNDLTGSPALATAADVGSNIATQLLMGVAANGARVPLSKIGKTPEVARVEPTLGPQSSKPLPNTPQGSPEAMPTQAEVVPVNTPATPTVRDAANKPAFSDPAKGVYAEEAPDKPGGIATADQQQRAAVLKEVGLDQVRKSAITGDASQAAIDFQTSRLKGSPGGDLMSKTLDSEKQALANYSDNITRDTGGSMLNDESAKYARGGAIMTPLEGLKEWFDNQTSALYKTADERAQGVPTQLENFRKVLGDDSLATNSDRVHLRQAVNSYAKNLGIVNDEGVFSNAQQAETMRKYLNENWSPQNSGLVGKLKDALDEDVMSAAGEDVYGAARALRSQRAATLDNPNGIAKLLDSSGPNGINRAVPVEKVSTTIANMPVDQLNHIVNTLKNMPPELQPMAADALAEIKAQFATNVRDIGASQQGQWNAKGVRKYLSSNSQRMSTVFGPEEMKKFGTLNDAGNILAKDQSYPGAFAQQHNLLRAGVAHSIQGGLAATGGAIAGAPGAYVGSALGGNLAGKFSDAATLRATQKRMVKLSDMTKPTEP